jgi:predicted metal-dependent peptidase
MSQLNNNLEKAKKNLIIDHVFFGSLLLSKLEVKIDNSIETACVDGKTIRLNSDFCEPLTIPELTGLLAHEILHCAMLHPWRQENREHRQWNEACDYAINDLLISDGFTLPPGALINPGFNHKEMSAEDIYNQLGNREEGEEEGEGKGKGNGSGDGSTGHFSKPESEDGKGGNQAEFEKEKDEWQVAVSQANNQEKAMGKGSGAGDVVLDEILQNRVNWREELRKFFDDIAKTDFTWQRPNKRLYPLILPSILSDNHDLKSLVIGIDSSGSVSNAELNAFITEIDSILQDFNAKVKVMVCDAEIQSVQDYEPGDQITRTMAGRGGTDFDPVFERVNHLDLEPSALIYLSDMEALPPNSSIPISYPVCWVSTQGFGRDGYPCGWYDYSTEDHWQFRDSLDDTFIELDYQS